MLSLASAYNCSGVSLAVGSATSVAQPTSNRHAHKHDNGSDLNTFTLSKQIELIINDAL
jgi:hypothetical protein